MAGAAIMSENDDVALVDLKAPQAPLPPPRQGRQPHAPEPDYVAVDDADLAQAEPPAPEPSPAPVADEPDDQPSADDTHPREPRADRRQRQKVARDRNQQELLYLRSRVGELEDVVRGFEPRFNGYDQQQAQAQVAQLDRDINAQAHLAADARRRLAEAVTNQDSESLNKALEDRDRAIMTGQQLTVHRNMLKSGDPLGRGQPQQQPQPQQQRQAPRMPSAVQDQIQDFASRHPWYNPNDPQSLDSQIVLQLDRAVATKGFDPAQASYWDELEAQMQDYLPHRFDEEQKPQPTPRRRAQAQAIQQQAATPAPQRRGPMMGAPADRGAPLAPNQVYISPERKQAMVLAGALDADGQTVQNEEKYKGYLKKYHEYDRTHGVARQ